MKYRTVLSFSFGVRLRPAPSIFSMAMSTKQRRADGHMHLFWAHGTNMVTIMGFTVL